MRLHSVSGGVRVEPESSNPPAKAERKGQNFDEALDAALGEPASNPGSVVAESGAHLFSASREPSGAGPPESVPEPETTATVKTDDTSPMDGETAPERSRRATEAYRRQAGNRGPTELTSPQKYKDDQLLRNPGGDAYDLDKKTVAENAESQKSFTGRVGKDLSDSFGNIKNFFGNLFMGAKELYRDANGEIKETRRRGLVGCVKDFFKDMGSALSFGLYTPDGQEPPKGFTGRLKHFASKLKDAVVGDLVGGIPSSLNHMGANLVLAGWNLVEVLPDATIGQFDAGRKFTTTVFDNGQVVVEYLTDIVPSGDAWMRVHASKLGDLQPPVLYNLKMPENASGDDRWHSVRNTSFRKTIETIGALLGDGVTFGLLGQSLFSSNRSHRVIE